MNEIQGQPLSSTPAGEFRQCFKCNFETITDQTVCPRCRTKAFFTSSSIRKRGVLVMLCGLFVAGLIGGIAVFVGLMLVGAAKDPASSKRVTDQQFTLLAIYAFFALLIGLGLQFIVTGGWMLAFGRRNRVLIWIMWAMLFVVFAAGGFITALT